MLVLCVYIIFLLMFFVTMPLFVSYPRLNLIPCFCEPDLVKGTEPRFTSVFLYSCALIGSDETRECSLLASWLLESVPRLFFTNFGFLSAYVGDYFMLSNLAFEIWISIWVVGSSWGGCIIFSSDRCSSADNELASRLSWDLRSLGTLSLMLVLSTVVGLLPSVKEFCATYRPS